MLASTMREAEDDLEPEVVLDEAERAPPTPQQDQRDTDDDRRHRERQVDDGLQQTLAAEPVARQHQGGRYTEEHVERHHDRHHQQRQLQRRDAAGVVIDSKKAPKPGAKVRHRISPTGTTSSTSR